MFFGGLKNIVSAIILKAKAQLYFLLTFPNFKATPLPIVVRKSWNFFINLENIFN